MIRRKPNRFDLVAQHPVISAGLVFVVVTATAGVVLTTLSSGSAADPALSTSSLTSEVSNGYAEDPVTAAATAAAPSTTSAAPSAHAGPHATHSAVTTKAKAKQVDAAADTSMAGMVMTKPKPGKWVSVNAAAQKKETAAFFATKPARITGNGVRVPEFNAQCTTSHTGKNDPIVFPGQAGKSHDHTFFGNDSTNARTTLASLLSNTASSCQPAQDHSSYWVPSVIANGRTVKPNSVTVYYGSSLSDHSKVQPFPQGLRMVVGTATNQVPGGSVPNEFYCQGEDHVMLKSGFPTCAAKKSGEMNFDLSFPECWDGKHLDSPDHKAHMANGGPGGKCPATHPVQVPSLHFVIHYPRGFNPATVRLSSGNGYSMHGDFFNAWEKPALAKRVRNCINQSVKCTTAGAF